MMQKEDAAHREYVSLLSLHYQRLYGFILMLVANHHIADEIMQETSMTMFEKFPSFDVQTDFLVWARAIARFQILSFLKKQKRDKLIFNQDIVDVLEQQSRDQLSRQEEWLDELKKCITKLSQTDRRLLRVRYYEDVNAKAIADRLGCSFQKVYRNISRINGMLLRCVKRELTAREI